MELLAFSIASACVRNVSIETTGPKISSTAIRCTGETSVNSVGANQWPRSGRSQATVRRTAPSSSPAATSVSIRSSCSPELTAPTSVFLSSGSPSRSFCIRSHSFASTTSATLSCTSSREPAQQTWPWLKKMPWTMPSTAWSIEASSKTMLADLPPSSSVSADVAAGERGLDVLADRGRAGEGDLVDARRRARARRRSRRRR